MANDPHKIINPHGKHGNFKDVEGARPDWDSTAEFHWTKTKQPDWQLGDGATDGGASTQKAHIAIDPHAPGRPSLLNYKLLISAIVPRPIGFISTRSPDGASTNLAPYSYTQLVNHDPPVFIVGYAGGFASAKDSLRNLVASRECVINIISEHYLEAANAAAVNAPYGVSEWALAGLTPAACEVVKASRVKEAVFSVEGKLMETREFDSRATPGKKSGVLAIIEGVRFWAREDAINEEQSQMDLKVMRPMARVGGISYVRVTDGIELPRLKWDDLQAEAEAKGIVKPKADSQ